MHPLLGNSQFLVKQHIDLARKVNSYEILDPQSDKLLMQGGEPDVSVATQVARQVLGVLPDKFDFLHFQYMLPFRVELRTPARFKVLSCAQGLGLARIKAEVRDERNRLLGCISQKIWHRFVKPTPPDEERRYGGQLAICEVRDDSDDALGTVYADAGDFQSLSVTRDSEELATVSNKLAGLVGELKGERTYLLTISDAVQAEDPLRALLLASLIWVDIAFYA